MARRTVFVALLTVCLWGVGATHASAQVMIYYTGDCNDFQVAVSGSATSASCSSTAWHVKGVWYNWRNYVRTRLQAWTEWYACPAPQNAYHLAETWHPTGGAERLNGKSFLDGDGGPIIRRTGTITVSGSLSSTVTPMQPQNCWVH